MTSTGDRPDAAGAAVPPTPDADDKDWTWVLQQPCAECGFDAELLERGQIAEVVRRTAVVWQEVLADPDVRRRPSPTVWSPLEYAAHCRDVYELFGARVRLMLHRPTRSSPIGTRTSPPWKNATGRAIPTSSPVS